MFSLVLRVKKPEGRVFKHTFKHSKSHVLIPGCGIHNGVQGVARARARLKTSPFAFHPPNRYCSNKDTHSSSHTSKSDLTRIYLSHYCITALLGTQLPSRPYSQCVNQYRALSHFLLLLAVGCLPPPPHSLPCV
jgi:hypothetical protein